MPSTSTTERQSRNRPRRGYLLNIPMSMRTKDLHHVALITMFIAGCTCGSSPPPSDLGSTEAPHSTPDILQSTSSLMPSLEDEPIPLWPRVTEIWEVTSYAPFSVEFRIMKDGRVEACEIVSVGGDGAAIGLISDSLEARFCTALESRRYQNGTQDLELALKILPPHLR